MLLTAAALPERDAAPSREAIREFISGNFCRCTGYQAIVDAVQEAARRTAGAASDACVVDRCFAEFIAGHEAGYRRWPENASTCRMGALAR